MSGIDDLIDELSVKCDCPKCRASRGEPVESTGAVDEAPKVRLSDQEIEVVLTDFFAAEAEFRAASDRGKKLLTRLSDHYQASGAPKALARMLTIAKATARALEMEVKEETPTAT